jgi:hypothetical protein
MHIGGEATADALAKGVRRALDTVKEIRAKAPVPASGSGAPALPPGERDHGKGSRGRAWGEGSG